MTTQPPARRNELTSAERGALRTASAPHSGVGAIVIRGKGAWVTAPATFEAAGVVHIADHKEPSVG